MEPKLANVVPLFKSGDPMPFTNCRPESLLSVISKVFEKVMYTRLLNFIDTYNILINNQFGFRKSHSSYLAFMALTNEMSDAIENGDHVVGIFLDFSKAFDTMDHCILFDKLYHCGIRDTALEWFRSYLTCRRQYVTYNGAASSMRFITCGVPQCSILGPLLFLIYINDLFNVCPQPIPILYADDTNLFYRGLDMKILQHIINNELSSISLWLKVNKLSLNISKTHYIISSRRKCCSAGI